MTHNSNGALADRGIADLREMGAVSWIQQ